MACKSKKSKKKKEQLEFYTKDEENRYCSTNYTIDTNKRKFLGDEPRMTE